MHIDAHSTVLLSLKIRGAKNSGIEPVLSRETKVQAHEEISHPACLTSPYRQPEIECFQVEESVACPGRSTSTSHRNFLVIYFFLPPFLEPKLEDFKLSFIIDSQT